MKTMVAFCILMALVYLACGYAAEFVKHLANVIMH